jgi:hypothetical protein
MSEKFSAEMEFRKIDPCFSFRKARRKLSLFSSDIMEAEMTDPKDT